jgi:1-deoxyxylulose-5-phosphate synthase
MQNHYNLLYREEEREMIPLCLNEGIGLVPWSPLGRGLLARPRPATTKTPEARTARAGNDRYTEQLYDSPDDWNVVDAVQRVANARGVSMAEVALAWLLGRPGVAAPIVGATKAEHLDAALKSLSLNLSGDECVLLETPYRPHGVRGYAFPEPVREGVPKRA